MIILMLELPHYQTENQQNGLFPTPSSKRPAHRRPKIALQFVYVLRSNARRRVRCAFTLVPLRPVPCRHFCLLLVYFDAGAVVVFFLHLRHVEYGRHRNLVLPGELLCIR